MNTFYITMSLVDQKDEDSGRIYGITAKSKVDGQVMFADYRISLDLPLVQKLADFCQEKQPNKDEFHEIVEKYKQ